MQKARELLPSLLQELLSNHKEMTIAFSGGVDSRFLCYAAQLCGCKVMAVHIAGPHVPTQESAFAEIWARKHLVHYTRLYFNPLELPEIALNTKDRCYLCKRAVFSHIIEAMKKMDMGASTLCDGGNKDDLSEFRPGHKAAREKGVLSPLALAGLGKNEIRHFADLTGLEDPFQRARPCLFTRFAYGIKPTVEKLKLIERIENKISGLISDAGANETDFRLRFLPEAALHIRFIPETLAQSIKNLLDHEGMVNCAIIQMDKVSGYHDKQA